MLFSSSYNITKVYTRLVNGYRTRFFDMNNRYLILQAVQSKQIIIENQYIDIVNFIK